jgi:hypothetical protein
MNLTTKAAALAAGCALMAAPAFAHPGSGQSASHMPPSQARAIGRVACGNEKTISHQAFRDCVKAAAHAINHGASPAKACAAEKAVSHQAFRQCVKDAAKAKRQAHHQHQNG